MATETLRPTAAGDETNIDNQWPDEDAHWDKVDEAVSDETTTFVDSDNAAWQRDFYNIADSGVGAGTINHITVYVHGKVESDFGQDQTSLKVAIKAGTGAGAPDTPAEGNEETPTESFVLYSKQWTTNPATSAAFIWAEIDTLQIGVVLRRCDASATRQTLATQVYVVVDYTAVVAGIGALYQLRNPFGINVLTTGGR